MRLTPLACAALILVPLFRFAPEASSTWQPGTVTLLDYEVAPLDVSSSVSDLAVAPNGDLIVVGTTNSTRFPLTADAIDRTCEPEDRYGLCTEGFLMILGTNGHIRYATYLGGDSYEWNVAVTAGSDGSAWALVGSASTRLDGSPTSCNGHQPMLVHFTPGESRYASVTCVGGPRARQSATDLALAPGGAVWVATQDCDGRGDTANALQPVSAGGCDIFVTKYEAPFTEPAFATYIGGSGMDGATAIATAPDGDLLIAGITQSRDFPSVRAFQDHHGDAGDADGYDLDGVLVRLDGSGRYLEFSTWLGGTQQDEAHAVAVDAEGNAYVAGGTWSDDFPISEGALGTIASPGAQDAFVASTTPDGRLRFSARFGGRSSDAARALAVLPDGALLISGQTNSPDFPGVDRTRVALPDGAVTEFPFLVHANATASALFGATLLSVQSSDDIEAGWAPDVRVDASAFGNRTLFAGGYTVAWHRNGAGEWEARVTGYYIKKWALGLADSGTYGNVP